MTLNCHNCGKEIPPEEGRIVEVPTGTWIECKECVEKRAIDYVIGRVRDGSLKGGKK